MIIKFPENLEVEYDPINHPAHYTSHPAGIECIQITEHLDFLIGNIIKYAWRAGLKDGTTKLLDLEKCLWYAKRAVEREKNMSMVH